MKRFCNYLMALLVLMIAVSCEDQLSTNGAGVMSDGASINVNVLQSEVFADTKAGGGAVILNNVFGSEDDEFIIEEYVSRIEDAVDGPATKGTEITTAKLNQYGKSFTVNGWGNVSARLGQPELPTNHLASLTTTYNGSNWAWEGADPKWIHKNPLHLWSYYPVGKITPTINFDDDVPANNTASFDNYTTDGTDLLIAYNKESREFQPADSKGNHSYDANGQLKDDIIGDPTFNVHFYHALAAVKFVLNSTTTGADVHSITLCYVDSDNNIVTTGQGIATTGDCVATGTGDGSGTVSFAWSNQGTKKALHYEFSSTQSVAGGYTSTGDGVLFMIPQSVQNIKVIVEFSKNGSTKYYTKVQNLQNVTWNAGYYYTYKLHIGEFHVPGEILLGANNLTVSKFKTGYGQTFLEEPLPIKNVTKVGVACAGASMQVNSDGAVVLTQGTSASGSIANYTLPGNYNAPLPSGTISFDFLPYSGAGNVGDIISFGNNVPENYKTFYHYNYGAVIDRNYVFDTSGEDYFNMVLYYKSGNNGNTFTLNLNFIMVLEVEEDPSLPGNFDSIDWSII